MKNRKNEKEEDEMNKTNPKIKFTVTNQDIDDIEKAQMKLGTLTQAEAMRQALRKGLRIILEESQ